MNIRTMAELQRSDGQTGTVCGHYREIDIRMRPKGPPQSSAYVAVVLSDGTHVMLEPNWTHEAIRPEAERKAYSGKLVQATGLVHLSAPRPPTGANSLIGPCLSRVQAIRLAESEGR